MAKRVRKLEDTAEETKHIIFSDSGVTGSNAGFAAVSIFTGSPAQLFLTPLTRGTTVQSRVGDKVVFTSIRFKLQFFFSSDLTYQCTVNWMIYKLKAGTTAITAANILAGIYGTSSPTAIALPDINNQNKEATFTVLKKGWYKHVAPTDATQENQVMNVIYRKKVYSEYRLGNAGTVADMNKNALYLLIWTDHAAADPGLINVNCEGHVFYHG